MKISKNQMIDSDELQLNIARQNTNIFSLVPEMPLYKGLQEISCRSKNDKIELLSHEEVWDD